MKTKTLFLAAVILSIVSLISVACTKDKSEKGTELGGSVKIAGSSTVYPVSAAVAEEFNRLHPRVEIPVQSTGTGGGFKNFFISGKTDINDASRKIKSYRLLDEKQCTIRSSFATPRFLRCAAAEQARCQNSPLVKVRFWIDLFLKL